LYESGRVIAHVDANGNRRRYTYGPNHTLVEVVGASGKVSSFWTQNFDDLGRNTGVTDALGNTTRIGYGGGTEH
jgi:YD repeat-containing protein